MLDQRYQYEVRSETNGRENNEDSFYIFTISPHLGNEPIIVLALADGMGGHAYGEHASRETLRKVSLALHEQLAVGPAINQLETYEQVSLDTLGQAVWSAIEQANAHLRRMVVANKWGMSGSTVVLAAIAGDAAIVANVGDSPLFHFDANSKKLKKLTRDHTVAGVLLEAGMITPEMARFHEGRSRLEFHIGSENLPREAPVHQISLSHGDLLLLCSDGISASLLPEQISHILASEGATLKDMADRLLAASRDTGETDNQTLILWRHIAHLSKPGKVAPAEGTSSTDMGAHPSAMPPAGYDLATGNGVAEDLGHQAVPQKAPALEPRPVVAAPPAGTQTTIHLEAGLEDNSDQK